MTHKFMVPKDSIHEIGAKFLSREIPAKTISASISDLYQWIFVFFHKIY